MLIVVYIAYAEEYSELCQTSSGESFWENH